MTDVHGQAQYGGDLPAQIWHDFMSQVVTPPCAQFRRADHRPDDYLPFSGTYQRAGEAAYVGAVDRVAAPPGPPGRAQARVARTRRPRPCPRRRAGADLERAIDAPRHHDTGHHDPPAGGAQAPTGFDVGPSRTPALWRMLR